MCISELTHPEDRAVSDETRRRLLAGPAGAPAPVVERRYLHKNGATVWALLCAAIVRDDAGVAEGVMGIVLDVTELRRAQQELEWKTALLATQQEASLDAILLVDAAGRIRSFNQRFVDLWGIAREAVQAGNDEPVLRAVVAQVKDPQSFVHEVERLYGATDEKSHHEVETLDGRTIERYSSPVIGPGDSFKGRIWFFRDVTDRKRGESRLRESEARFRQMAETIGEVFWMSSGNASTMLYVSPRVRGHLGPQLRGALRRPEPLAPGGRSRPRAPGDGRARVPVGRLPLRRRVPHRAARRIAALDPRPRLPHARRRGAGGADLGRRLRRDEAQAGRGTRCASPPWPSRASRTA
jgi:PAS domain S-box-containing protein